MTERVDKQRIMELLRKTGLWQEAERFREEVRQRLREEGKNREEAVAAAWDAMAEKFLPLAEQSQPPFLVVLPDGTESFDDLVDSDYGETDPVCQMRDAYVWIAQQFHRVVSDHGTGTVLDFGRATAPPPVGIACSIVQSWAAKPCQKRDGLYREIRQCVGAGSVEGNSPEEPEPKPMSAGDAYLDSLGDEPDE